MQLVIIQLILEMFRLIDRVGSSSRVYFVVGVFMKLYFKVQWMYNWLIYVLGFVSLTLVQFLISRPERYCQKVLVFPWVPKTIDQTE